MRKRRRKVIPQDKLIEIGRSGGMATLKKKGPKFFSRISKRRKTFTPGPGRPKGSKNKKKDAE